MRWFLVIVCSTIPFFISAQNDLKKAKHHIETRSYEQAEKVLLEALKSGSDPELRNMLGEIYAYQLQWDKAIDIYRELSTDYPAEPDFQFRYGGVLAKKAQQSNPFIGLTLLGKIKTSFKKTLALDPGHLAAHWALIDLYVSLPGIAGGSFSRAYEYAESLKEYSLIDGYLALGYVYEYDGKKQEAKQSYIKALGFLDDQEVMERNQLNYQIGKICGELELEMDRGILHLKAYADQYTVLDGVPLEWAYFRLAKLYRKKADKDQAMMWIRRSLELSPDLRPALDEKLAIERL